MSHQIVECPGCLTKLRVKESQTVIKLSCPRCGEQLAVDPPEPGSRIPDRPAPTHAKAPAKPAAPITGQKRPVQPAAEGPSAKSNAAPRSQSPAPKPQTPPPRTGTPSRSDASARPNRNSTETRKPVRDEGEDWETQGYDSYPSRPQIQRPQPSFLQKHGLLIGILGGGGLVMLVLFVGGIYWLMQRFGTGNSPNVVAQNSEIQSPVGGRVPQSVPPGVPPGVSDPGSLVPNPAPVTPNSSAAPFNGNGGTPGNGNVAVAAVPGDTRKLRYDWKPGAEFIYQFSIKEGEGDSYSTTTGTCSYKVEGSAGGTTDEEESSGTGFVIGADGVLATCAHVVEGARRLEVNLGGKSYPATVVAVDAKTDVALIRISATGLTALSLANSDSVQLAESVRAIGYPLSDVLGTDVKVTTGTVAGIVQDKQRGKRIQIDAAINPGNSGGPVVSGGGLVVGVASAKLSGSSVTSVGFAAPVNDLRALAATVGIQIPIAAPAPELSGPEVARRITPSVAYIRAWGNSGGRLHHVTYTASFSESQQQTRRIGRGFAMPGPPSFPSHTSDRGRLTVNALGEVVEFQGEEQLPAVLGPVGLFFVVPLDAYSESQWQTESETSLRRIKRDDSPFGGPFGGRRGFGPPGFPDPFGRGQEDEVLETIPATEKTTYRAENSLNNRISIAKSYEFTATRTNGQPYMNIRGNGTLVFDTMRGMPSSMEFNSRIQQDNDGERIDVPVKITYTLRSLEELQQERDQAEVARKKQEEEKSTPNPALVDEILAQIKAAEGGNEAVQPLTRLGQIAVVDSKRDEVIRVMRNHMSNSNAFVRKSATEVFCMYGTKDNMPDLRKVLEDRDGLMIEARKRAFQTVAKVGTANDYPALIALVTDPFLRQDARNVLISVGPAIEDPILKEIDAITDGSAQSELIEVLRKIGTSKSIAKLEQIAKSGSGFAKNSAAQALDAIRARQ